MLCGTCRVAIQRSDKLLDTASGMAPFRGLSPMSDMERARLSALEQPLDGSVRLACQLRALGDISIEALVPLSSRSIETGRTN